ncbi:hypothetical protein PHYC_03124 [Phycisphaerales bacterium]|nr:hypothetical protein PHYC_03124 [Phycisphaerales bacterium]
MIPAMLVIAAVLGPAPGVEPLALKLQTIRETREIDMRPADERPGFGEGPGIEITFVAALPKGCKVLGVKQPEKIDARDSAGTDLSPIRANVFDDLEYMKFEDWFDEASLLHVRLGQSARSAETFTAHLEAEATTFTGVESHDVDAASDWTKFTHPSLAGAKAEYRYQKHDEGGGAMEIRPTAARELIESIVPAAEGAEPAGYSISYSDDMASFDIEPLEPGQKIRLFVRTEIKKVLIVVDLKDQKLP